MKYLRNKNAPPTAGLVQEFIDTAYDTVKLVADNLDMILAVGQAIEDGTLDDFLEEADINTLSKLNAIVLDAEIASEAYVDDAVTGLYDFKGGYDAGNNIPDLTTSPNGILLADTYQVTDEGEFFSGSGVWLEPGDQVTAAVNDPSDITHWVIVNRNIDSAAFATAEQGAKADTALQPGEAATPAQGALADTALQPLDNISELTNDAGYTDDQTDAEIATAYNTVTPVVSQADAEAGTSTTAERWTPERVAQAITAQAQPGGSYAPAEGWGGVINGISTTYNFTVANLTLLTVADNLAASDYLVPDSLGVSGNTLSLFNKGVGPVTVDVPGTDVLISTENVCEQNQAITILKVSPTEWAVIGGSA